MERMKVCFIFICCFILFLLLLVPIRDLVTCKKITDDVRTTEYVVREGDTLWDIARRISPEGHHGKIVWTIRELNGLESPLIRPGQRILIPSNIIKGGEQNAET